MAQWHKYPTITEELLEEITKRRYLFKSDENGKLFLLVDNKQALIIMRERLYKSLIKHAEKRKIRIDAIQKQFTKVFILCSYDYVANAKSLAKLCKGYRISRPKKINLILFKEIGEENAKKTKYDTKPKKII